MNAPQPAIRALVIDSANFAFRGRPGAPPKAAYIQQVDEALAEAHPAASRSHLIDASVWGWLESRPASAAMRWLKAQRAAGLLSVLPRHQQADRYVLRLAQRLSAVVVSNDDFREASLKPLRAGVPLLRVAALPHGLMPADELLIYPDAAAKTPTHTLIPQRPVCPAVSSEAGPTPQDAGQLTLAALAGLTSDQLPVRLERLASQLAQQHGAAFKAALAACCPGQKRRFIRLCERLPGWQLVPLPDGGFALAPARG